MTKVDWLLMTLDGSWWLLMTLGDSRWLSVTLGDSWWLLVTLGDSWWLSVTLGDSRWLSVLSVTLGDSRWLSVTLGDSRWLSVTLGDSRWWDKPWRAKTRRECRPRLWSEQIRSGRSEWTSDRHCGDEIQILSEWCQSEAKMLSRFILKVCQR